MSLWRRLVNVYRTLAFGARLDRDLDDELAGYVAALIEKNTRAGLDPVSARREALIEFGGVEQVRQEVQAGRVGHGRSRPHSRRQRRSRTGSPVSFRNTAAPGASSGW